MACPSLAAERAGQRWLSGGDENRQQSRTASQWWRSAISRATAALLRTGFTQLLPRGTVLFEQDDQADFLHMTIEGSIGLQARDERGSVTTVEIFGAGELFLTPAAVLDLPYLASAVALTEVRVLMTSADVFRTVTWRRRWHSTAPRPSFSRATGA